MIADTSFASFLIHTYGMDVRVSDAILGSAYAAAVRVADEALFDALQEALDQLEEDGTIARLRNKWID
jgi:ABC-type amino acid transport substrate-binding protein